MEDKNDNKATKDFTFTVTDSGIESMVVNNNVSYEININEDNDSVTFDNPVTIIDVNEPTLVATIDENIDTSHYSVDSSNDITFYSVGEYPITYTATDKAGNSDSQSTTLKVYGTEYLSELLQNALTNEGITDSSDNMASAMQTVNFPETITVSHALDGELIASRSITYTSEDVDTNVTIDDFSNISQQFTVGISEVIYTITYKLEDKSINTNEAIFEFTYTVTDEGIDYFENTNTSC